jgi:RNA polymerase sigma factor (sigma-70 family)
MLETATAALVGSARAGDVAAFEELIRRYQGVAFGCALAILGDRDEAADALQEALVAAYRGLGQLADADAFPSWLRGIVRHTCHRVLRQRRVESVPLERATTVPGADGRPEVESERRETHERVRAAIDALPAVQREVVALFYLGERSQAEVAAFLGVPISTVNNRLHAARANLKKGTLQAMNTLGPETLPADFADRVGRVLRVSGPILDVRFPAGAQPELFATLRVGNVEADVIQILEDGLARALVPSGTGDLAAGATAIDSRVVTARAADADALAQALELLAPPPATTSVVETGLKAIDLLCPLISGARLGLFGGGGVGKLVLAEELRQRLAPRGVPLSVFVLIEPTGQPVTQWSPVESATFLVAPESSVQTYYLPDPAAAAPTRAHHHATLDAAIFLTSDLARCGLFPAVDPAASWSRALDPAVVGAEHAQLAERARAAFAAARPLLDGELPPTGLADEQRVQIARGRKLARYLAQPMYVAEPFTKRSGVHVPLSETLRSCAAILDGAADDLPETALYFIGALEEARDTRDPSHEAPA